MSEIIDKELVEIFDQILAAGDGVKELMDITGVNSADFEKFLTDIGQTNSPKGQQILQEIRNNEARL